MEAEMELRGLNDYGAIREAWMARWTPEDWLADREKAETGRVFDDQKGNVGLPAKVAAPERKPPEMAPEVYANIVWSCG